MKYEYHNFLPMPLQIFIFTGRVQIWGIGKSNA